MKAHIRRLFFENKDLYYLIRNDENNENWPSFQRYVEDMKEWNGRKTASNNKQNRNQKQPNSPTYGWFASLVH